MTSIASTAVSLFSAIIYLNFFSATASILELRFYKYSKWNALEKILLLVFHLDPSAVTIPSSKNLFRFPIKVSSLI